jgi:hypothetical protein
LAREEGAGLHWTSTGVHTGELSPWPLALAALSVSRLESACLRAQQTRFQHDASQSCRRGQKQINIFLYIIDFSSDRVSICEFLAAVIASGTDTKSKEYVDKVEEAQK